MMHPDHRGTALPWLRLALAAAALIALRLLIYAAMSPAGLAQGLCQWDCGWYMTLAQDGYDAAPHLVRGRMQANWAFFPAYPMLVRVVAAITSLPFPTVGMAIATAAFWAFALLGGLYRERTRRSPDPWLWLLLLAAWPYGFYFDAQYSESLYALVATACLLALAAGRPWLAAAATAVLTATRPTGVLMAIWFGLDRLWAARHARSPRQAALVLAPLVLAPLGLVAFMAFLLWRIGDPLAFAHIQTEWDHQFRNPLSVLMEAVRSADPAHGHVGILYLVGWALLGLIAAGWLLVRRLPAEAWLCAGTPLMALTSGVVWSMPRFVAVNPVLLLAAADLLQRVPSRAARIAVLVTGAALQLVMLSGWFRGAVYLT